MKHDPFQGLDQRLFTPSDKSTSQQANKPARLPAVRPTSQPSNLPGAQQHAHPRSVRHGASRLPESRVPERHTYDIYEDQARWMNRLKLEMDEEHRAELTSNGIVQLAIDALRADFEQNGQRSQLFVALVRGKPWQGIQAPAGTEGDE